LIKANIKPGNGGLAMFFVHGYIYFFAWNIFVLVSIATARYMRDKWETNMVLHTAVGMFISVSTIFWGFWAINFKKGFDIQNTYANRLPASQVTPGNRKYLHTFSAMAVPLMSAPIILTGFIAYFRRW
jgi:ABC-type phosphate transport system permease subunit